MFDRLLIVLSARSQYAWRLSRTILALTTLLACLPALVSAGDLVRDERRLWSDGSPQEVWSYDGALAPEHLVLRELFWEDGTPRSREEYAGGVRHGASTTWYPSGHLESEETWVEGGRHGAARSWPDPGDDKRLEAQLKPVLEATWEAGELHGVWRSWEGWGEDRWLRVERSYSQGELDGFETVWRSADQMVRKHSWKDGELDGRQLAWDYNGQMAYQFAFVAGTPDGPQRAWEGDTLVLELFFVDGLLHGTMTWPDWQQDRLGAEWRSGLVTEATARSSGGVVLRVDRDSWAPGERFDSQGRIQFVGERAPADSAWFDEAGRRTRVAIHGEVRWFLTFHPSGSLARFGRGEPGRPDGLVLAFFDDGTLAREEHYDQSKRVGEWTLYDPRGRPVQRQTWDYYLEGQSVTVWHDDGVKAAEGDIEHHHGTESGRKTGQWSYWAADGRLLRTEEYGPGPYSGNRSFIRDMTEWDPQGRVRFEGSEKELVLYDYDPDAPDVVRRKRTVKLLDRARFGVEGWDPEARAIVRDEVTEPAELAEGAETVELLGGRGVVLLDERFRGDGSPKRTDRWRADGWRHGVQEGWYPDGSAAYTYEYARGQLETAREWWSNGRPRLELVARRGDAPSLRSMSALDKAGSRWELDGEGRWRGPAELLEACWLWMLFPDGPGPSGG